MNSRIMEKHPRNRRAKSGFTIIELVVSISIVGILMAIILPAVMQARESARKLSCKNNLHQLGVAIHDYEAKFGYVPPGWGENFGWLVEILPQMEYGHLYNKADFSKGYQAPENQILRGSFISTYVCPSDAEALNARGGEIYLASYSGNYGSGVQKYGYNGVFQPMWSVKWRGLPAGPVRFADITDGLSNTAAVSEILVGDGSGDLLRTLWNTPRRIAGPDQLDEFAAHCASEGPTTLGGTDYLGGPWLLGNPGASWYNHVNTPNKPSCTNKTDIHYGCYPPASLHNGGVNLLYADGHVQFISDNIDLNLWRALGSRNGAEENHYLD